VCGAPISPPTEGPSPLEGVPLRNVDTGEVVPLALAPHEDFDTLEGFSRETYMMQHGPRVGAVDSSPGASSASPAGECTQGEAFVSPTSAVNMRGCGGVWRLVELAGAHAQSGFRQFHGLLSLSRDPWFIYLLHVCSELPSNCVPLSYPLLCRPRAIAWPQTLS
jgi:hypothetical protein